MNIYYHTKFNGYYPAGTRAIIIASNLMQAKELLERLLESKGLKQEIDMNDFIKINPELRQAIILNAGKY